MKFGYARVSNTSQDLELQQNELLKAGCQEIFSESISTKKTDRPELNRMLNKLRENDTVVVYKLNRLARSTKDLYDVAKLLEEKKVNLVTLNNKYNIDTTSPMGKFFFVLMDIVGEFGRDIINESTRNGIEKAKEKGTKFGRKKGELGKHIQEVQPEVLSILTKHPNLGARLIGKMVKINFNTVRKIAKINGFNYMGQGMGWVKELTEQKSLTKNQ